MWPGCQESVFLRSELPFPDPSQPASELRRTLLHFIIPWHICIHGLWPWNWIFRRALSSDGNTSTFSLVTAASLAGSPLRLPFPYCSIKANSRTNSHFSYKVKEMPGTRPEHAVTTRGVCWLEHAHLKEHCFKGTWRAKRTADAQGGVRVS